MRRPIVAASIPAWSFQVRLSQAGQDRPAMPRLMRRTAFVG